MRLAALIVAAVLWVGVPVSASWTAPPLALTAADSTPTALGTLVRLDGRFPASDLVARRYPFQVFVQAHSDPGRVVCFSALWGTLSGWIPLADEFDLEELIALAPEYLQPDPGGELVYLGESRIEVMIPPEFPRGRANIVLSVEYQGAPVLSNDLEVTLP